MDDESAQRWEIDQDEFGNPLVRHRHPTTTISAYVVKRAEGDRQAQCPACGDTLDIPSHTGNR